MGEPYYTGDNILIKFTVTDSSGGVNPTGAVVWLYHPETTVYEELGSADIDDNVVSYLVASEKTSHGGQNTFYIILQLPVYGERTYRVTKELIRNPS